MSVPDLEYVVQQVRDSQEWDFTTKEGLCAYANACVYALYQHDPAFGHLKKSEAQNHCDDPQGRFCATDVALYLTTGQIVDFISSAGYGVPPPANSVVWQPGPEGEYSGADWFAPVPNGGTPTPIPPDPSLPDDIRAQLNRIEQNTIEIKLFISNMNDQLALQGGVINQLFANQNPPYAGTMVRTGDQLELHKV